MSNDTIIKGYDVMQIYSKTSIITWSPVEVMACINNYNPH